MKTIIGVGLVLALVVSLGAGAPAMAKKLPQCDGSFQDCLTKNGDFCKAGGTEDKCECSDDMSDCPNHPILAYQSGFKHGIADAKLDNANMSKLDYVEQPGKGLDNHTPQFANGYVKGWCSIMGPNTGKELDDTVFDCERTN